MFKLIPRDSKICLAGLLLLLAACDSKLNEAQQDTRSLAEIRESGKLIVLTRNAPTAVYTDRDEQQSGPEHDMVKAFADVSTLFCLSS